MRRIPFVSVLFCLLGILLLCGGVGLAYRCADSPPVLLTPSEQALSVTEEFAEAFSGGDLESAGALLSGSPQLSFSESEESSISALVWDSYIASLQFSFQNTLMPTTAGCCRTVTVTGLDIPALMQQLKEDAPELLARETALIGEDLAFGEDNHYRQDFVMEVLYQGLQELLSGAYPTVSREYQLELVLQDDVWQILPDQALLDLLCGKIA